MITRWMIACLCAAHALMYLGYGNLVPWSHLLDVKKIFASGKQQGEAIHQHASLFYKDPFISFKNIKTAQILDQYVPAHANVLTLRPADMYYTHRRMVSYLDPIMLPMYALQDAYQLSDALRTAGIHYVYMPNYFIPPVNRSALMSLLGNTHLAELLYDNRGNQIYALKNHSVATTRPRKEEHITDLTHMPWLAFPYAGLDSPRFSFEKMYSRRTDLTHRFSSDLHLFSKNYSHMLLIGDIRDTEIFKKAADTLIPVIPGTDYIIQMTMEGEGYFRIWKWGREKENSAWNADVAGDFVLTPDFPRASFKRRIRIPDGETSIRIGIERYGVSSLKIHAVKLIKLLD